MKKQYLILLGLGLLFLVFAPKQIVKSEIISNVYHYRGYYC